MVQLYKRKGGEVLVNTETLNSQFGPNISRLAGGGFLVAWTDNSLLGGDDSVQSVKAQRYDAAGDKLGGEFLVNSTITGSQANPQITTLNSGNFELWHRIARADLRCRGNQTRRGVHAQFRHGRLPRLSAAGCATVRRLHCHLAG